MSKFINTHEIVIDSSLDVVWRAMTDQISRYLKNMKVVTDWKQGSTIIYTHYEDDGTVTVWQGMQMIWSGVIEVLKINEQLDVSYTDQSSGLIKESYILETVSIHEVKVTFTQELISEEMANNYKEGNEYTLNALKTYVETIK